MDLTTGRCCPLRPCARLPSTLCTSSDFTSDFLILLNKPVVHPQLNPSLHFQNDHVTLFAHSPSRTVMLILIFNSTAYCHAHSLILYYILYSVLYILFFIHFILCILPLCCILQYLHCPCSGPDSYFTAGYTISV